MAELRFERGVVLLMSSGEYSDFGYCGELVTLKECDLPALAKEYIDTFKKKDEWDDPRPTDFPSWLVALGHCAPLNCQTVHVGNYGEFDTELVPYGYPTP